MAKSVDLKGVSRNLDQLTKDLKNLQRQPATAARQAEADALHDKLTTVQSLLNECPDSMFQMFAVSEPMMAAGVRRKAAKRPAKKAARKTGRKKTSRKGSRKVR